MNPELFEPFENLIDITVNGSQCRVPENNTILRCLQYLSLETISYGDFCWNGDCSNCMVRISADGKEKDALACLVKAKQGMSVLTLSDEMRVELD